MDGLNLVSTGSFLTNKDLPNTGTDTMKKTEKTTKIDIFGLQLPKKIVSEIIRIERNYPFNNSKQMPFFDSNKLNIAYYDNEGNYNIIHKL